MLHYQIVKPVIGITCGEVTNSTETWSSVVYGQSYTYSDAIIHAGGVPFILPITDDMTALKDMYDHCDGILLAGGNDIDPARYDQTAYPETKPISSRRDTQETRLLEWSLADDKPVLGICRGMQLLNVCLGGSLHQHIPRDLPGAQNHTASREHKDTTYVAHNLKLEPASKLAAIVGSEPLAANSQHHQAVDRIGSGLVPTAWAEDGVVEAIEVTDRSFAVAVQPHPEGLEATIEPRWRELFRAFVAASAAAGGN